jgi:hypothetical protein
MVHRLLGRGFERLGLKLAVLLQKDLHFAFSFLQLFSTVAGKLYPFLEQFESLFKGDVPAFEFIDYFFEPLQAIFKLRQSTIPYS